MSYWGATVITKLISAIPWIGSDIVNWVWGGFSVGNPTLNRFFSLHYLLPFVLAGLVVVHLIALHEDGSNNPIGINSNIDKIPFHPYFIVKDLLGVLFLMLLFGSFVYFAPNYLGHSDNYIPANPLVTPAHIQPEWYFLFAYAILRSIPNKALGVVALFASLLVLLALPFINTSKIRSNQFRPLNKILFWFFVSDFFILTIVGAKPVEAPWEELGALASVFYFTYFLILIPLVGIIENKLFKYSS